MSFSEKVKTKALVACGRCCCICHKQCGVRIECHHIIPEAKDGANTIENCIPLCFDCHAEVEHYNSQHPKGNMFSPEELRGHRDKWFEQCAHEEASGIDPQDMVYLRRAIQEKKDSDFIRGFNGDDWK